MRTRPLVVLCLALALLGPVAGSAAASAGGPDGSAGQTPTRPVEYSVLQLNLCLSGLAGCYAGTEYPAGVDEAVEVVREHRPRSVTVNEACSGDVERLAEQTGMDHRFATVLYRGSPLPCVAPGGRGVFGNAVLTRARIATSQDEAFRAQSGAEERRWLCVRTTDGVRVCTTHLSVAGSAEQAATNQAQCEELSDLLAQGSTREATVLGGDVNRIGTCAPLGFWTLRDDQAAQAPGIQHVYLSRDFLLRPRERVLPLTYTDHDGLLVSARLRPTRS